MKEEPTTLPAPLRVIGHLYPRTFSDKDKHGRFIEFYHQAGLQTTTLAYVLALLATFVTYLVFGIFTDEGLGWSEGPQVQRISRLLLLATSLGVIYWKWTFWEKHWIYLAGILITLVYLLGPVLLYTKTLSISNIPYDPLLGWRGVANQTLTIILTFAFLRFPIAIMLTSAIASTIVVVSFSFVDFTQAAMAASILATALIMGTTAWVVNYRRELKLFQQSLKLEESLAETQAQGQHARESEIVASNLLRQRERLQRAVTHDMRQPMAALSIQMGLLSRHTNMHPELQRDLAPLGYALEALHTQIEQIGRDSDGSNRLMPVETSHVDLRELVVTVARLYTPIAEKHGIRISSWVCNQSKGTIAITNAGYLTTILESLIGNAIKFANASAGRSPFVLIALCRVGDKLSIRVFDNGIGIEAHNKPLIFDEGFTTRPEPDGNGLGLFNVQRLTKTLPNHHIDVYSSHGRYSNFVLRLPSGMIKSPSIASTQIYSRPVSNQNQHDANGLLHRRILIVEDNDFLRNQLQSLFKSWGATVVATIDAESALKAVEENDLAFEVAVCDYNLGDGDTGLTVAKQLRNTYGGLIGVAIITGERLHIVQEEAEDIRVFSKPFDTEKLRLYLLSELSRIEALVARS